jgi:hypothetical protein
MAPTLYPLPFPPMPWHTVGIDYLTHLLVSNGFDSVLILVDHLTRMAHFLPCTTRVTQNANLLLHGVYRLHGLPRVLISDRDPNLSVAYGRRFGVACDRDSICLPVDTHKQTDQRSPATTRFSSFFVACVAMMDQTRQICCIKWDLRTARLVR